MSVLGVSILSVDLGTSNTVAALAAHGRPPRVVEVDGSATTPSAACSAARALLGSTFDSLPDA
ncbi:hypothetical protein [Actinophytocola sp.]|uniref:hypothetical protein n=1 Tax=Actinophytocola sp. TaxID=1872138 RepID=UPI002EDA18F0